MSTACDMLRGGALGIVFWCGVLVVGTRSLAIAHHPSSTARVGSNNEVSVRPFGGATQMSLPRLSTNLMYSMRYFSRVKEGRRTHDHFGIGRVSLHMLSLQTYLELESNRFFGARVPIGIVAIKAIDGQRYRSEGVGDIEVSFGQKFGSSSRSRSLPWAMTVRVGLMMPTGQYETDRGLAVTDRGGGADSSTKVLSHSTQASLGSDAWSPFLALQTRWQLSRRMTAWAGGSVLVPVTRTRDEILSGADVSTQVGVNSHGIASRLNFMTGLDYRHHFQDEVRSIDETMGVSRMRNVGGRDEFAVIFGAGVAVSRFWRCSMSVRVPIWQQVDGIQIVETISGTASCAVMLGL